MAPVSFQKFEGGQWGQPFDVMAEAIQVDVRNTVIKDVSVTTGTVDYVKYNPDDASLNRPEFTFTIEDLGDPHEYEYTVYMRQSIPADWTEEDWDTDEDVASVVGQITSPGSVTVTWDGSQEPGGDPDTMPAGVYSFDIFAREYDDVASEERELLDETGFKAPYATWVSELDSWIAVDEEGNAELRVKYMFTDDYDRGAVGDAHVTVLDADLDELAVVDVPTETGVLHGGEDEDEDGEADGIVVYGFASGNGAGDYLIRLSSIESCKALGSRLSNSKKNLGGDDEVKTVPLRIAYEFVTFDGPQDTSNFYQMKKLDEESWVRRLTWTATSGCDDWNQDPDYPNEDYGDWRNDYNHEWEGPGLPYDIGGPIPRTSSTFFSNDDRHAIIATYEEQPGDALKAGMTAYEDWNGDGLAERVRYKFGIYTSSGRQTFKCAADTSTTRGGEGRFLVHPDGNLQGTAGCIGIQPTNTPRGHGMEEVRRELKYWIGRNEEYAQGHYWDLRPTDPEDIRHHVSFESPHDHVDPRHSQFIAVPLFIVGDDWSAEPGINCLNDFIYYERED